MANYFKSLNESFDRMYGKCKLTESDNPQNSWFDLSWDDQVKAIDESCSKGSVDKKPMNEDGAEDFLHELSDTIRKDIWDVVFDDVADSIDDLDNLPDYLPMTAKEAHDQFLDAVRKLAESAFIKYCVYIRDSQVDEGLKEDKKPPQNNAIDRYQRWVDFDIAHYGKISKRTQDFVNKAGYQILKDDHGDYEVAAGHFG